MYEVVNEMLRLVASVFGLIMASVNIWRCKRSKRFSQKITRFVFAVVGLYYGILYGLLFFGVPGVGQFLHDFARLMTIIILAVMTWDAIPGRKYG